MADKNNPTPASDQSQPSPSSREAQETLERIINLSKKEQDIISDINKLKDATAEIDRESYDLSRKTTAELLKHQEIHNELRNLVKRLNRDVEEKAKKAEEANTVQKDAAASLEKAIKAEKEASSAASDAADKHNKSQAELQKKREIENIKSFEDLQTEYLKKINELEKINAMDRAQDQNDELARTKDLNEENQKKLDLATLAISAYQRAAAAVEREYDAAKATAAEKKTQLDLANAANQAAKDAAKAANAAANDPVRFALVQQYTDELESIKPTIAALRQKKKAMDEIDKLLESHVWQFNNIKTLIMGSGLDRWLAVLKLSVNILKQFVDRFKEIDAAAGKFRDKTGITTSQMTKRLEPAVRQVNVELARFGVNIDESFDATAALAGEFQVVGLVTKEAIRNTALLAANLGISVTDTAKLGSLFTKLAGDAGMTMNELTGAAAKLAEMGGVAPSLVLKDMAEASEQTLTFLAKTPMQLARAAVEARRLGTTINSIAKTARAFLNFQESITAELEASALIGKSLNFQESRLLAFQGKIIESRKVAMQQLEEIGDFTSMNVYQQEAIARAMNMTVEEIVKQQNQQKILAAFKANATAEDLAAIQQYESTQEKIAENERNATNNVINQGREFVKNANRQTQINQLTSAFKSMWTSIVDAAMPLVDGVLLPTIKALQSAAELIAKIPSGFKIAISWGLALAAVGGAIYSAFKLASFAVGALKTIQQIPAAVSAVAGSANAATGATTALAGALNKTGDAAVGLGGAMKQVGNANVGGGNALGSFLGSIKWSDVGKIAAMMAILAGGLYVLGKSLVTFNDVDWSSLGKAAVALLGLMALGGIIVIAKPLSAALIVLAGAAAVVGAALLMAGKGIQLVTSGFADLERARTERMQKLPETMLGIATAVDKIKNMNSRDVTKNVDAITDSLVKLSKSSTRSFFSRGDSIFDKLLQLANAAGNLQSISNSLQNIQMVSESMAKSVSEKINASVNVIATTAIEVKNLNELKETVEKLINAISTLGGTAGGGTPIVNVTTNAVTTAEKISELVALLKEGKLVATVDLDKLNAALNSKNTPAGR